MPTYVRQELTKVKNALIAALFLLPIGYVGAAVAYRELDFKAELCFGAIAFIGWGLVGYSIERIYSCFYYPDSTE